MHRPNLNLITIVTGVLPTTKDVIIIHISYNYFKFIFYS